MVGADAPTTSENGLLHGSSEEVGNNLRWVIFFEIAADDGHFSPFLLKGTRQRPAIGRIHWKEIGKIFGLSSRFHKLSEASPIFKRKALKPFIYQDSKAKREVGPVGFEPTTKGL